MAAESAAEFEARLSAAAECVEQRLAAVLETGDRPARLMAGMRHAVFAGGKRLRPFLVIEGARLCGADSELAVATAAAIELVHTYSLVHDDLPALDNDALRRGQPTVHVAYDEATAILVGDGLQTLAFALVAGAFHHQPAAGLEILGALALAAGIDGMVGGQMLDLAAEGRFGPEGAAPLAPAAIARLQALKTGALLRFSACAGALIAGQGGMATGAALARYGEGLGLAFQIKDDLLDCEGDAATMGKAVGKDASAGKATFIAALGLQGARDQLIKATADAEAALAPFGAEAGILAELLHFNLRRLA